MGLLTNLKKRGLKDIFSKRVFAYIESIKQKIFGVKTPQKDMIAYAEQIIFKRAMCPACHEAGHCLHCGCDFKDLSVSKEATCSEGKWGKVMNDKEWAEYKDKYMSGIDFGLVKKKI
jgi:hypothetical protein